MAQPLDWSDVIPRLDFNLNALVAGSQFALDSRNEFFERFFNSN